MAKLEIIDTTLSFPFRCNCLPTCGSAEQHARNVSHALKARMVRERAGLSEIEPPESNGTDELRGWA